MLIQYYKKEGDPDETFTLPEKDWPYNAEEKYSGKNPSSLDLLQLTEACIQHHYTNYDGWEWRGEAPSIVVMVNGKDYGLFHIDVEIQPVFYALKDQDYVARK